MKKTYLISILLLIGLSVVVFYQQNTQNAESNSAKEYFDRQMALKEKYGHLSPEEIKKLPKKDRPDLAMLQEFEMTKDPALGYPPTHRKVQAFEYAKSLLSSKSSARTGISNVDWVERGPNNVAGRTRALMWDPNDVNNQKVWAGSVGGGL